MRVFVLLLAFCASALGQGFPFPGGHTAHGGGGTWTLVQHKFNDGCAAATTCTVTVSALGSGHQLELLVGTADATNFATLVSVSGGGTWTQCAACTLQWNDGAGTNWSSIGAYNLSSSSGATSVTVTVNHAMGSGEWAVGFAEWSWSGSSASFDTGGTANNSGAGCTSCTGPTLTLTGSSDALMSMAFPGGAVSAATVYTTFQDFLPTTGAAFLGLLNTSSGSPPAYTQSPSSFITISSLALKGNP